MKSADSYCTLSYGAELEELNTLKLFLLLSLPQSSLN